MEKELVELFERVKKAADAAEGVVGVDSSAAEDRCIDALKRLKVFPINYDVLLSTKVGIRFRQLTKHPRKRIQSLASDVFQMWKAAIAKEIVNNKKNAAIENLGSLKRKRDDGEDFGDKKKVQRVNSIKVKAMEKELVDLFERVKKAADAAAGDVQVDSSAAEDRCIDALKVLKGFPINYDVLVSTKVGKRLRQLTKHPRKRIQFLASDVVETWKATIVKETGNNKKKNAANENQGSFKRKRDDGGDSGEEKKAQRVNSIKVEDSGKKNIQKVSSVKFEKKEESYSSGHVNVESVNKEDKFKSDSKKAVGPPNLTSLPSTKDKNRDKIRELLADGLGKVADEVRGDLKEAVDSCDPLRVATEVESELFSKWGLCNGVHKAKYRSVLFNLKDKNNPDFRRKVLLGQFPPRSITYLSPEDMASDERQKQNEKIKEKALFDCERGAPMQASKGAFQCSKCKKWETTYYQMQTRSADEPMTTFVSCTNCGKRWKC